MRDRPHDPESRRQAREEEARIKADLEQKLQDATRKREQAQAEERAAHAETLEAVEQAHSAKASLAEAVSDRENAVKHLQDASAAVLEAERILQAAKMRQQEVIDWVSTANFVEAAAEKLANEALTRRISTEIAEQCARVAREHAEREEKTLYDSMPKMDEETQRQAELEEMIRRMKELREQEENDRRERQMREQQEKKAAERAREEAERLAREEFERQAREEEARKTREEQERRGAEARRLQEYEEAAAMERDRCIRRDSKRIPWLRSWTTAQHVDWLEEVSLEFDNIKFCSTQPLTFASIPWPILSPPQKHTFDDIEWSAVEAFFIGAKTVVDGEEYKAMVEKAHRRFHPDKWRSRGLLSTVLDETERERLERAGNVVAQAITPIWLASRKRG